MGLAKKVVLAYSGGVATSVCIPYLKEEYEIQSEKLIKFKTLFNSTNNMDFTGINKFT